MATTGSAFQGFHHHHLAACSTTGGSAQVAEKVKFTVSVHGHQLSSARHVHETLQEFARVIERNARRLEFIGEGDSIQRLQLVRPDGSEPEELDVDATLEDVLICMGDKQLVAMINSGNSSSHMVQQQQQQSQDAIDEKPPLSPLPSDLQHQRTTKLFFPKNDSTPSSYSLTPTSCPTGDDLDSPTPGCSKSSPPRFNGLPLRGLKISIPPCEYSSPSVFSEDGEAAAKASGMGGFCTPSGLSGLLNCSSNSSTPSPAELAQFLIRGSSKFGHCAGTVMPGAAMIPNAATGMQASFLPGGRSFQAPAATCAQGAPNIALLAQFLAAQLRAFTPAGQYSPQQQSQSQAQAQPLPQQQHQQQQIVAQSELSSGRLGLLCKPGNISSCQASKQEAATALGGTNSIKLANSSKAESHDDRDASSSSANMNNVGFPSFGMMDNAEQAKGRSELVFLVNRRSKMGVGTHHLKMSDLSSYFHLSIVDAAKKLGVSQTTLKKACRKFGLKRWPGRKVRSLESTIHGLEHTIAVGQGAGMEDLTEAYMRSEVLKLQQEMDQLVHGIPAAQHLPMVRTADLYKRLYSRGWRSKFHSPCSRLDFDLNSNNSQNNENNKFSNGEQETCAYQEEVTDRDATRTPEEQHQQQERSSRSQISRDVAGDGGTQYAEELDEDDDEEETKGRTNKRPKMEEAQ